MKHSFGFVCLIIAAAYNSNACDVCGTSSGNQALGLLPQMYSHFAGIQFQQNGYHSTHIPLSSNKPVTYSSEEYSTLQLWGRITFGKRWQLFAFVPYKRNISNRGGLRVTEQGTGDASVLLNYTLLQSKDSSQRQIRHRLQGGVGIKAPTGRYRGVSELERAGLPNIQPGTGSWDIPANLNYTIKYKNSGLNADISYVVTTPNRDNYKYGNRLSIQPLLFYWISLAEWSVLPQLGMRYEYILHDYDNYSRKWLNEQTGGTLAASVAGVQVYYRKLGLQLSYSKPLIQNLSRGNIEAKYKIDIGTMILF